MHVHFKTRSACCNGRKEILFIFIFYGSPPRTPYKEPVRSVVMNNVRGTTNDPPPLHAAQSVAVACTFARHVCRKRRFSNEEKNEIPPKDPGRYRSVVDVSVVLRAIYGHRRDSRGLVRSATWPTLT